MGTRVVQDEETSEALPDVAQLDAMIAEAEAAMATAETSAEKRKAKERKEDLMRLKRVELIYVSPLYPAFPRHLVLSEHLRAEFGPSSPLWMGPGAPQAAACDGDCVVGASATTRRSEPPPGGGVP